MKKKIAILCFLLMISIFFVNYVVLENDLIENKKVLLIGEAIVINSKVLAEVEENEDYISTSNSQVGIMTAINMENKQYFAFGHKISIGTELDNGNITTCLKAKDLSVQNDKLSASMNKNEIIGNVIKNEKVGVTGVVDDISVYNAKEVEVASKYEVKKGEAVLYVDLDGNGAKEYTVNIESFDYLDNTKNLKIKITDEELLEKTGGIIRGMSGTPVLQNGKLVGAVNCVSMYDKTDGYAIFASEMFGE